MPAPKRRLAKKPTVRKSKKKNVANGWKVALVGVLLVLLSPFYYSYVLKIASTLWFKIKHPNDTAKYRTYESFNIKIPKRYSIHGIDVSYYQGKVDWQKVSAMKDDDVKISLAFIKATEGLVLVDSYFRRNWREAPKAGIKVGPYHFFRTEEIRLLNADFP